MSIIDNTLPGRALQASFGGNGPCKGGSTEEYNRPCLRRIRETPSLKISRTPLKILPNFHLHHKQYSPTNILAGNDCSIIEVIEIMYVCMYSDFHHSVPRHCFTRYLQSIVLSRKNIITSYLKGTPPSNIHFLIFFLKTFFFLASSALSSVAILASVLMFIGSLFHSLEAK